MKYTFKQSHSKTIHAEANINIDANKSSKNDTGKTHTSHSKKSKYTRSLSVNVVVQIS